jgi:hypothetical protein
VLLVFLPDVDRPCRVSRDGLDTLTGCHGYQNELSAGVHNTLPGYKGDVTALDFVL